MLVFKLFAMENGDRTSRNGCFARENHGLTMFSPQKCGCKMISPSKMDKMVMSTKKTSGFLAAKIWRF